MRYFPSNSHYVSIIVVGMALFARFYNNSTTITKPSIPPHELITSLKTWFGSQNGSLHSSVNIGHNDEFGYHLRANSPIPGNTNLISVPFHLSFSILTSTIAWPALFARDVGEDRYWTMTRFALAREYLLGVESKWYPYISILPQPSDGARLGIPLYWKDNSEERRWIRGTSVEGSEEDRHVSWRREWTKGMTDLSGSDWAWNGRKKLVTWELYKWAGTVVATRAFPETILSRDEVYPQANTSDLSLGMWLSTGFGATFPVLVPMLDFPNHDPSTKNDWAVRKDGITFTCSEPVGNGTEIFYSYGPKPNVELLQNYGFTLPANDHELYVLSFAPPSSRTSFASKPKAYRLFLSATHDSPPQITLSKTLIHTLSKYLATDREGPSLPKDIIEDQPSIKSPNPYNLIPLIYPVQSTRLTTAAHAELLGMLLWRFAKLKPGVPKSLPEPSSGIAVHAARYRRSEEHIITSSVTELRSYLSGLNTSGHFLTLQEVLTIPIIPGPQGEKILTQFRNLIKSQLETLDPNTLNENSLKDGAWVFWICTVWMASDTYADTIVKQSTVSSTSATNGQDGERHWWQRILGGSQPNEAARRSFQKKVAHLIRFLKQNYCPPPNFEALPHDTTNCKNQACFISWMNPPKNPPKKKTELDADLDPMQMIQNLMNGGALDAFAESLAARKDPQQIEQAEKIERERRLKGLEDILEMIRKAAGKGYEWGFKGDSIYADERWSKEFLWWGNEIWKSENVAVPKIVFQEGDKDLEKKEMVLFLEDDV